MRDGDDAFDVQQLVGREVRHIAGDLAGRERGLDRGVVHQVPAGEVDDAHAVLHLGDGFGVDHSLCVGGGGDVNRDIVGVGIDFVVVIRLADGARQTPCGVDGDERVAADHLHPQPDGGVGDEAADGAQADDAQRLAEQLGADESAFALFDELFDALLERFCPSDAGVDFPGGKQQRGQRQFLDAVGVGARGVEHDDALLAATVKRDVVDARARARDGQQLGAERHLVHRGRADEDMVLYNDLAAMIFAPSKRSTPALPILFSSLISVMITDSRFQIFS